MSVAMEDWPRRHRITVDEYHRMAEVGLLAPDARVELIDGEIIEMPLIGSKHGGIVGRLTRLLVLAVGEHAIVRCQLPLQLGERSEPQPDLALCAPREDFYGQRNPQVADALLVIEVSDSTERYDLSTKMALYAQHGVRELWVANVRRRQLHVFRNPVGAKYEYAASSEKPGLTPVTALPGIEVDLESLFRLG